MLILSQCPVRKCTFWVSLEEERKTSLEPGMYPLRLTAHSVGTKLLNRDDLNVLQILRETWFLLTLLFIFLFLEPKISQTQG